MDKLSGTNNVKNIFKKYITFPSQSRPPPPETMLMFTWIIMAIIAMHVETTLWQGSEAGNTIVHTYEYLIDLNLGPIFNSVHVLFV